MANSTKLLCLAIIVAVAGLSSLGAILPSLAQTDNETAMMAGNSTNATMAGGNMTGNMTDGNMTGQISGHGGGRG